MENSHSTPEEHSITMREEKVFEKHVKSTYITQTLVLKGHVRERKYVSLSRGPDILTHGPDIAMVMLGHEIALSGPELVCRAPQ